MRDVSPAAGRLLRITLGLSALLVGAAVLLGPLVGVDWGRRLVAAGITVVVAGPFVALVVIAAVSRRASTVAYAVAGLLLAIAGMLVAR